MSDYVIWIDSKDAYIFALKTTGVTKQHVKKGGIDHHTQNKKDQHADPGLEHYFQNVVSHLDQLDKLLIVGPGLTKNHFKAHLETQHAGGLAKHIAGIESSDHPTENQILAEAHKFFKGYDLYNKPIAQS